MRVATIAFALAMLSVPATARQDELCGACKTTGKLDNPLAMSKGDLESDVIWCSAAFERDKKGSACEFLVCPNCRAKPEQEAAKQELDMEVARRKKWVAERQAIMDTVIGHDAVHIKTRHFTLSSELSSVKVGQTTYNMHQAAHLYAKRIEEVYANLLAFHGLTESQVRQAKRSVFLIETPKSAAKLIPSLGLGAGTGGANRYGDPSSCVCVLDKKVHRDDEDFHKYVAHSISHHVHNDVRESKEVLYQRYGWVSEGLAHWVEIRWFGTPNTWCTQEAGTQLTWGGKSWESNVKKTLLAGQAPVFEAMQDKPSASLTAMEHQFAWSYIDYLLWLDPAAMPRMLGLMKGPQLPVRDCLQTAYGISVPAFVAGWEEFVKAEYSTADAGKGPQPREPRKKKDAPPAEDEDG